MSLKIYFASVLTAVLILAPTTYFILPLLYPGMNSGVVVQSNFIVFDSNARINDSNLAYIMMADTTYSIQTQGGTSLTVLFTASVGMWLNGAWTYKSEYTIALVVEGITNRDAFCTYHRDAPAIGSYRFITFELSINLDTGMLEAGTYIISVYWKSTYDAIGTNYLDANFQGTQINRSLWIQEILN